MLYGRPPAPGRGSSGVRADREGSVSRRELASHMSEETVATTGCIPSSGLWRLAPQDMCWAQLTLVHRPVSCRALEEGLPYPHSHHPLTVKSKGARLVQDEVLGSKVMLATRSSPPLPAAGRSTVQPGGSCRGSLTPGMGSRLAPGK